MSHVSHRSTLPPPPDRVGRLTGTAAVSVHATSIAGGTQRDPEGTSREPRRHCYGHRRGISLPKAPYQNAAQMSRGAEGTTAASGRRDQAGLAARKRQVGAVRGAVPAQNEPKSDRPRAKTRMNRRKSRLRRRAAPNWEDGDTASTPAETTNASAASRCSPSTSGHSRCARPLHLVVVPVMALHIAARARQDHDRRFSWYRLRVALGAYGT